MKKLIVAEKPSVAKDIARVLGAQARGDGYLYGEDYVITWALGHLVSLCESLSKLTFSCISSQVASGY